MASDQELLLYKEIINRGCCQRCALRYLCCDKTLISFDFPSTSLVNFGYMSPMEEFEMERPSKKKKPNACTVCLGLFQDPLIEEIMTHEDISKIAEYKCQLYTVHITFPACVLIRDHSMKIHLQRMFPETFNVEAVTKINHFWRQCVEHKLSKLLGKKCNPRTSKLTLHFYTSYQLENEEVAFVQEFVKDNLVHPSSRHSVATLLQSVPDEKFIQMVNIPPKVPFYSLDLAEFKVFSESIHLIGNYCKYSRKLLQMQIPDDLADYTAGDSVENIIVRAVKQVVGEIKQVSFQASSFDDPSVRVLGNGKTFHLQLFDPKFEEIPRSVCQKIEKIINKTKVVRVTNLQQNNKKDISLAMDSENLSPRLFKALCLIQDFKNLDQCINAVNMYPNLMVNQKLPIRMLHQNRRYDLRKKKIYFMKATKLRDNLIELELCIENGLNIREFIDGDLGRTSPSVSEIMRAKAGILALDVIDFRTTLPCAAEEGEVVI
ncbi:putative tRNA pseudouridine synthase Pus10 [Zophobas morio]|uniref:putative tRNA pseudouridine synthase Pus10 n=1 Tax=Zophobas morio TaxID=2755281 RepID=UPI00308327CE